MNVHMGKSETALLAACESGQSSECVELLLIHGANIVVKGARGIALKAALRTRRSEVEHPPCDEWQRKLGYKTIEPLLAYGRKSRRTHNLCRNC